MERNKFGKVQKRTFICEFGGKYKTKKDPSAALRGVQCNTRTKKPECQWHCNLSLGEHRSQKEITTFVNKHNHKLSTETHKFRIKYRSLTEEALKEVEIMTKHANLSITTQRSLLKARLPDLNFQDSDIVDGKESLRSTVCCQIRTR